MPKPTDSGVVTTADLTSLENSLEKAVELCQEMWLQSEALFGDRASSHYRSYVHARILHLVKQCRPRDTSNESN